MSIMKVMTLTADKNDFDISLISARSMEQRNEKSRLSGVKHENVFLSLWCERKGPSNQIYFPHLQS